jgi:hypothetical protein
VYPLHADWVQHLTGVEFAMKAAVSTSTTLSPCKATLGIEPKSPTMVTFEDNDPVHTLPEQVKILFKTHGFAHDCVKAAQAHMHQQYANRHRSRVPFTFRDMVKLKAANIKLIQQSCFFLRERYIGAFSLKLPIRRFPRSRFGLSYPPEYRFKRLYKPIY